MIKYFLIALYLVLAGGAYYLYKHQPVHVEPVVPAGADARLWKRGRIMYNARCVQCHNSNPDLPGSVGPKLRGVSQDLLVERLTHGKGAMPVQKDMLRHVPALHEYLK